ncbi:hypothetical protein VNO77_14776 [Canavalia gladiata]|uniref:Uncharacterized protein n=1 Tax=Canavalia gladiata TaxID=3824 RepID=A0AAN9LZN7_CANGL
MRQTYEFFELTRRLLKSLAMDPTHPLLKPESDMSKGWIPLKLSHGGDGKPGNESLVEKGTPGRHACKKGTYVQNGLILIDVDPKSKRSSMVLVKENLNITMGGISTKQQRWPSG